ncbi:hypothetical protein L3X37_01280 [Sabulilitoribacter arenilitoris]|uniref:Bulb-type lectin domain-containing protein n=1 Tax=Wocania arenilitoris TaxID=2044858 RepID=A0AAE3ELA7_9FLAO|nr:hypothetical protein [Wocania arenilitoris]MCF7566996.1 hypothetical protein [Wocania arenilitoris]
MLKKCLKILSLFILVFCFVNCSKNEDNTNTPSIIQPEIEFVKTFGGSKNESAKAVIKTQDGGYTVFGYTQSTDGDITDKIEEGFDYWLLKFDAESSLQWQKTFGGSGDDRGSDIVQTADGGFAVFGFSQSNDGDITENAGASDFWILKLDASGNISWQKSFGFSGADDGISLIETSDNGYLITGVLDVTASGGLGNSKTFATKHAGGDYWAIKLNATGNKQWSKFYGGTFTDTPYDVIQTSDNGYILVGASDSNDVDISNNKGSYDFWVIKISETGTLQWEKSFGGSEIDEASGITNTNDGNYIIVGDTRSNDLNVSKNNGAADLWVIKISPLGELIWEKTFGGNSFDVARSITKTQDNGYLISGSSRSNNGDLSNNNGQNDAWVLKIDADANLKWQKTIGGTDIDFAFDVIELNDKSIIGVGETNSSDFDVKENKGFTDMLIFKIK